MTRTRFRRGVTAGALLTILFAAVAVSMMPYSTTVSVTYEEEVFGRLESDASVNLSKTDTGWMASDDKEVPAAPVDEMLRRLRVREGDWEEVEPYVTENETRRARYMKLRERRRNETARLRNLTSRLERRNATSNRTELLGRRNRTLERIEQIYNEIEELERYYQHVHDETVRRYEVVVTYPNGTSIRATPVRRVYGERYIKWRVTASRGDRKRWSYTKWSDNFDDLVRRVATFGTGGG